jgi:hypothetical protein
LLPIAPIPSQVPREVFRDLNFVDNPDVDGDLQRGWKHLQAQPKKAE